MELPNASRTRCAAAEAEAALASLGDAFASVAQSHGAVGKDGGIGVWIGTSGWQYRHWKGAFYPRELPLGRWLEVYGTRFATVEVNNAFYRLPEAATFERWAASTPEDFVFALKASRYVTHVRRLSEPQEPVHRLLERAEHLGGKLGPILVQLPATLPVATERLEAVLRAFPSTVRVALEPRHASWFEGPVRAVLERYDAALCLTDLGGPRTPLWRTAEWGYLRFHEGKGIPVPCYERRALDEWAERIVDLWPEDADVFVFFNNDGRSCAPRDARLFAAALERVGRSHSRVPGAHETPLNMTERTVGPGPVDS